MLKISAAFVKAQKEFGPAIKNAKSNRNTYADLSACLDAVIDAFHNSNIAIIQMPHESKDGITVETIFLHESGEQMSGGKLFIPCEKKDAQGFGSALTYARRYSLMASCGLAPEDDDGKKASEKPLVKAAITDDRLRNAIGKIALGQYTTDKLRSNFSLTEDQEKMLLEALSNA